MISYEKLEVYQLSLDCVEYSLLILKGLPKGYAELSSQLKRAAFSVCDIKALQTFRKSYAVRACSGDVRRYTDYGHGNGHGNGFLGVIHKSRYKRSLQNSE